jgi:hypothetical protein
MEDLGDPNKWDSMRIRIQIHKIAIIGPMSKNAKPSIRVSDKMAKLN